MNETFLHEITLIHTACCNCGVVFGLPSVIEENRRKTGGNFYCPNGHPMVYKNGEYDKLKRRARDAEAQVIHERDQRQAAERSAAATRGQLTKLKNRVANGVCPCCHRTFKQLTAHMARKHPDYREVTP